MDEKKRDRIRNRHIQDDRIVQREELRRFLSSPNGRRLLWGILDDCGTFSNPHSGNALDSAFKAGMMAAGQALLTRIEDADPFGFIKMQEENLRIQQALAAKLAVRDEDDEYASEDD